MKILRIALLVFLLVGCIPAKAVATPEQSAKTGTMYFLAANNSDPFYKVGVDGFNAAGKALGWKTEFVGPMDLSVSAQISTFETLCANPDTKGVFWYAVDFNAGEPTVKECVAKGIPVVIGAADSPFKTRNAFVGYNNTVLGNQAAEWAAKLVNCQGTVGTISVNGANLTERTEAFNKHIVDLCPNVKVYERATHDGSAASATSTIDSYLVAHPDLTLLWFADGGAGQQSQVWKDKQSQGVKTMFLATDMPPATLQAVKDGVFVGSVGQDTYTEEYWGVLLMDALQKGLRVPDTLYLSAILVDKNNVDKYMTK